MSVMSNLVLLANESNWQSMGDRFSGDHLMVQTEDIIGAIVVISIFIIGYLTLTWVSNRQGDSTKHSPIRLFKELCDAHGLDSKERRLLKKIAEANAVKNLALLFTQPELYAKPVSISAAGKQKCQAFQSRLFS